ncbi:helix-turn-helix transcriptional regulator [Rhodanobacter thiooxydans]|uniref:helix-turn-helix transcriptional regulator n=2 Tax=Rhodanobacteraceae TaxID=1775411 RepID=UPI001F30B992|nr:AlpA family phage regulatory protein [Rhodanobacter thiooxydans]UJJ60324.1 AlpA family phage regulatory protein [Rhodanobacter denitrificans]
MSRSWIYREVAEGCFPKPLKLNLTSAWLESDVDSWIQAKVDQRDQLRASTIMLSKSSHA